MKTSKCINILCQIEFDTLSTVSKNIEYVVTCMYSQGYNKLYAQDLDTLSQLCMISMLWHHSPSMNIAHINTLYYKTKMIYSHNYFSRIIYKIISCLLNHCNMQLV